jgi:uncharacterized protein (DUF1800 family)
MARPHRALRETYSARDVSELAKVFTGWDVNGFNPLNPTGPFAYWRAHGFQPIPV